MSRSVIAFSPAGGWRSAHDYQVVARSFRIFYALVDVLRFLFAPAVRLAWIRKVLLGQAMEHGERVPRAAFGKFLRAMSNTTILPDLLRTMGRDGPVALLDAVGIPIRIAWCECDRVIPFARYGEPFVERINGAEVTFVPGVGHIPLYDDPDQVAANILEVTGRVDAAAAVGE